MDERLTGFLAAIDAELRPGAAQVQTGPLTPAETLPEGEDSERSLSAAGESGPGTGPAVPVSSPSESADEDTDG